MFRPAAIAVAVTLLALLGCEGGAPTSEQRQAITETVNAYLDAVAECYSTLDVSPLEGIAAPNEIAAVRNLLTQLMRGGDRVESTLRSAEIEYIDVFREINATAKVLEVWDIVRYDSYSGREKGRIVGSVQTSVIQMRKVEGQWLVVGRVLQRDPTPTPARDGESGESAGDDGEPPIGEAM